MFLKCFETPLGCFSLCLVTRNDAISLNQKTAGCQASDLALQIQAVEQGASLISKDAKVFYFPHEEVEGDGRHCANGKGE